MAVVEAGVLADGRYQDESEPIETTFELNETLFAKAEIPPTEEVYLWLGVRVPGRMGGLV